MVILQLLSVFGSADVAVVTSELSTGFRKADAFYTVSYLLNYVEVSLDGVSNIS